MEVRAEGSRVAMWSAKGRSQALAASAVENVDDRPRRRKEDTYRYTGKKTPGGTGRIPVKRLPEGPDVYRYRSYWATGDTY